MIRLGITGGIGSGKSMVSQLFRVMGIPVYDSDKKSKRLTITNEGIRTHLTELVGKDVYADDGSLNKSVLASWLFSCEEHTLKVNNIIHPVVKEDFLIWVDKQEKSGNVACGIESAILIEAGFQDVVERIVAVTASLETRIERTMQRDGASRKSVQNRIARQMNEDEKKEKADFVINNDENTPLIPQVCHVITSLFKK